MSFLKYRLLIVLSAAWVAPLAIPATLAQEVDAVSGASYSIPLPPRAAPRVLEDIENWLAQHWFMSLATAGRNCNPHVSGVTYYSEGSAVYFRCRRDTSKYRNIKENPNVSYTVWDRVSSMDDLRSLQVAGSAHELEGSERDRINRIFETAPGTAAHNLRFFLAANASNAFYAAISKAEHLAVIAIEPRVARYIDNNLGMGHSDIYHFGEDEKNSRVKRKKASAE